MISYDMSWVFAGLVDQLLPDGPSADPNLALMGLWEIHAENAGFERDGLTYHQDWRRRYFCDMRILVTTKRRVYLSRSLQRTSHNEEPPLSSWKNISNHGDGWHTTGVQQPLTEAYLEAAETCWSQVPEGHRRSPAEADVEIRLGGFLSKQVLRFVRIKRDRSGYFDKLLELENVPFSVVLQEKQ